MSRELTDQKQNHSDPHLVCGQCTTHQVPVFRTGKRFREKQARKKKQIFGSNQAEELETELDKTSKNRCLLKVLDIKETNLAPCNSPSFHSASPGAMCQALRSGLGTQQCPASWEGACLARGPCPRSRGNSCHWMERQRGSRLGNKEPLLCNQHPRGTAVPSVTPQLRNLVVTLLGSKKTPLLSTCQS